MKEATGEGSMTIITIVIIVALGAVAALLVNVLLKSAQSEANVTGAQKTEIGNNLKNGFGTTS